jgi:hypothetical protein
MRNNLSIVSLEPRVRLPLRIRIVPSVAQFGCMTRFEADLTRNFVAIWRISWLRERSSR